MTTLTWPVEVADRVREDARRIVITGASGWLGRSTLELLHQALGEEMQERVVCFGSSARTISLRTGLQVDQRALTDFSALSKQPTLCLHFAFLTRERAEDMSAQEYREANLALREQVLHGIDASGVEALFVASSGATYRHDDSMAPEALRLYGSLKVADEEAFAAWAEMRNARAVITRIFTLSGPYINKLENYALASFIRDGLCARPITVQARSRVLRSYVAIRELMEVIFRLLLSGPPEVVRFDSGGDVVEMGELATLVSRQLGGAVDRPIPLEDAESLYIGDVAGYTALRHRLGVRPISLDEQILDTIAYMREHR